MKCLTCFNIKGGSGCTRMIKELGNVMCKTHRVCIFDFNHIPSKINKDVVYHHIPYEHRIEPTKIFNKFLAAPVDCDYVLIDFPKSERGILYNAFLAAGVIDYTIIPTNEDPLSISCTLEFAAQLMRTQSRKVILLNDIEPENKQYARAQLSKVNIPVLHYTIPHIADKSCPGFSRLENEQNETLEIIIRDFTSLM